MTLVIKGRNHLSFEPMQVLYNLINTNIQDINADRIATSGQWIFPTVPESNDENYPRVALINRNIRFEEYGAGRFIEYERNATTGDAEHMVFGKVAILPITIAVFVKKKQRHEVEYYDGTTHPLTNTKQADYLGEKIEKYLEMLRETYFIPQKMDIKILGMSRSYADNDFLIGKNIDIELSLFDAWEYDFTDAGYNEGIIHNINLTINII